jgi:competence protein ComEC
VGIDNNYGHPTNETLGRLEANGVDVYRTDLNGTVTIIIDGTSWEVSTAKKV